jgi:Uma2 family endonuclease
MTTVTALPWSRELTVDDLDALPDDGHRHELIDGTLIVTPAPSRRHQAALQELAFLVRSALPEGLTMLWAPFDVRTSRNTSLLPDVLVAASRDFTEANLPVAPLLAVEVLSPSTEHLDRGMKKNKYEALGTPSYWIVDPAVPSVTAWELVDGGYVEAGHAEGDEALVLERPFPVRIVPQELVP